MLLIVEMVSFFTGNAKQAPYDVIIFSGAIEQIPKKIIDQIADGGRLVTVNTDGSKSDGFMGKVIVTTKFGDLISKTEVFDAATPPLLDFKKKNILSFNTFILLYDRESLTIIRIDLLVFLV